MSELIFSSGYQPVKKSDKNVSFSNFSDECFCMASGAKFWENNVIGVKLATDSTAWAYRQMRIRNVYRKNKKKLLARINRTVNLSLYQKKKLPEFSGGFAINVAILILGEYNFWVSSAGDLKVFLYRDGLIDEIIPIKSEPLGKLRYGLITEINSDRKFERDIFIAVTSSVIENIEEEKLRLHLSTINDSKSSIDEAIASIFKECNANGATTDLAMLIVKHL